MSLYNRATVVRTLMEERWREAETDRLIREIRACHNRPAGSINLRERLASLLPARRDPAPCGC